MNSEEQIELVTEAFDSHTEWHFAENLSDVIGIFREVESFCESNGMILESEIDDTEFEELEVSFNPEEERDEVKFVVPIQDSELCLEFFYHRNPDAYSIWVDVDYYVDDEEDDDTDNEG